MKKGFLHCMFFLLFSMTFFIPSNASALLLNLGHDLVLDTTQRLFWYDYSFDCGFDDWDVTEAWAEDLDYSGLSNWRLPTLDEMQYLGQDEFRNTETYDNSPFNNVGNNGAYYLSSTVVGNDQRYVYSFGQDEYFGTCPATSAYGVAVIDLTSLFGRDISMSTFEDIASGNASIDSLFDHSDSSEAVPTPEPGSLLLLGLGLTGITAMGKKIRKK